MPEQLRILFAFFAYELRSFDTQEKSNTYWKPNWKYIVSHVRIP